MNNQFYIELAEMIKEARHDKKLSQQDVADRLNVTRACVANWEQGRRQITITDLVRLADVLNVDVNQWLNSLKKYVWKK